MQHRREGDLIQFFSRMCIIHSSSWGRGVYDTHPWFFCSIEQHFGCWFPKGNSRETAALHVLGQWASLIYISGQSNPSLTQRNFTLFQPNTWATDLLRSFCNIYNVHDLLKALMLQSLYSSFKACRTQLLSASSTEATCLGVGGRQQKFLLSPSLSSWFDFLISVLNIKPHAACCCFSTEI